MLPGSPPPDADASTTLPGDAENPKRILKLRCSSYSRQDIPLISRCRTGDILFRRCREKCRGKKICSPTRRLAQRRGDRVNPESSEPSPDTRPKLLIVDDDENFCLTLQRAFGQRGYAVRAAYSAAQARAVLTDWAPAFAVVDLRMRDAAGLTLIPRIKAANPAARVVVLTGYASIATAIEAIKLGATHYLAKPVDAGAIELAFGMTSGDVETAPSEQHPSVDRLAWEYIQRVLAENGGNISATARALNMHRRTLQRKLNKFPARR